MKHPMHHQSHFPDITKAKQLYIFNQSFQNTCFGLYCQFSGEHCTLVAHSRCVDICLKAAKELAEEGIECEVIKNDIHIFCLVLKNKCYFTSSTSFERKNKNWDSLFNRRQFVINHKQTY